MIVDVRRCLIKVELGEELSGQDALMTFGLDEPWRIITGDGDPYYVEPRKRLWEDEFGIVRPDHTYYVEPRKRSWEVDSVEEFERAIQDFTSCKGRGFLEIETDHRRGDFARYRLEDGICKKEKGRVGWWSVLY